jgi:2-methylisocitrate lyase-like PEP mutase family enzyme
LLSAVSSICAVVGDKPVSVDIEGGYSDSADEVADLVAQLGGFGVAGINVEDGTGSPDALVAKIRAIKQRVRASGGDVFVNARTDVFLRELATGPDAVRESSERAARYAEAGADGIFVPYLKERAEVRPIAAAAGLPLNVLAMPGLASAAELYPLGVRRISAGSSIADLALGTARSAAEVFLRDGTCDGLFSPNSIDYDQTNAMLRS